MSVIISLEQVGVRYRTRKSLFRHDYYDALSDVSFEVHRGETLGIVGNNGAGKSTLLKVLSGIYKPDSGRIVSSARKTSLLALQAGFDPNLNGRDNAVLMGMLMGYSRAQVYAELDNIEEYAELGDFFYQPIKTYSTGMRARLGFSTTSFLRPEVLLVDEVLGVGDKGFKAKATATVQDFIRSDQTVIIVSHSEQTINNLCDRVVELEKGRVIKLESLK
ncbi:ABC transporter ATP-binding protein [Halioxenophilus sp. WMMB6]|uniref:ABC transporter ATP-binding protein n=1 Tax=Halioxenophilus sp. WMMB6 TaxID=3073815 RepID=UPI00295E2D30|nr:ABC transporter ATP-binding protein [Halioxenophilus sp. WMMB6]